MLTEDLKRQLSGLRRGQPDPREAPVRARELAATTPRGPSPPTTIGRPRSSGRSRCSTDAKKASMSTWMI